MEAGAAAPSWVDARGPSVLVADPNDLPTIRGRLNSTRDDELKAAKRRALSTLSSLIAAELGEVRSWFEGVVGVFPSTWLAFERLCKALFSSPEARATAVDAVLTRTASSQVALRALMKCPLRAAAVHLEALRWLAIAAFEHTVSADCVGSSETLRSTGEALLTLLVETKLLGLVAPSHHPSASGSSAPLTAGMRWAYAAVAGIGGGGEVAASGTLACCSNTKRTCSSFSSSSTCGCPLPLPRSLHLHVLLGSRGAQNQKGDTVGASAGAGTSSSSSSSFSSSSSLDLRMGSDVSPSQLWASCQGVVLEAALLLAATTTAATTMTRATGAVSAVHWMAASKAGMGSPAWWEEAAEIEAQLQRGLAASSASSSSSGPQLQPLDKVLLLHSPCSLLSSSSSTPPLPYHPSPSLSPSLSLAEKLYPSLAEVFKSVRDERVEERKKNPTQRLSHPPPHPPSSLEFVSSARHSEEQEDNDYDDYNEDEDEDEEHEDEVIAFGASHSIIIMEQQQE